MSGAASSARGLAGLIDVLDRADGGLAGQRPRRPSSYRPAGSRSGVRTVPLRSVQPAPMARRQPGTPPASTPVAAGGLRITFRSRAAMWGAGSEGEYLAWRRPAPRTAAPAVRRGLTVPSLTVRGLTVRGLTVRGLTVRGLLRRAAMWGAGPDGEYLAWGTRATRVPTPRVVDGPVVLREMPSTPTIQPAAPSPAAAQPPRGSASSAGPRGMPPVPRGAVAVPGRRPLGPPERSRATGWPSPTLRSTSTAGLIRTRGDPLARPARGSPP